MSVTGVSDITLTIMKARYSLLSQDDIGGDAEESGSLLGGISDMWSDTSSSGKKPSSSHARPEKSVTLRLYTMQKHHFLLSFIIFLALFFIAVMLGVASPDMVQKTEMLATDIQRNSTTNVAIPGGPFLIKSPKLNRYNQQLWLMLKFKIANNDESFSKNFTVMLSVVGLNKDLKKGDIIGYRRHNRTRTLQCTGREYKYMK